MTSARSLEALAIGWQALCFLTITILLPQPLFLVGLIGSTVGISIATAAVVLRRRPAWIRSSLLDVWFIFLLLLISQAVSGTIGEFVPITLLQFVMVLFSVELLTAGSWYLDSSSKDTLKMPSATMLEETVDTFVQSTFRRVAHVGLLFASCYLLSFGALYLSAFAASSIPILTDISLYIVVVSVALALLILSREE